MGAGKSTIGRHLALELEVPFVDTDAVIVARHGPIADVFAARGEAAFRAIEHDVVVEALDGPPSVIALGGGAVTHAPTRSALAERAVRVYLDVPATTLLSRLRRSRTVRPVMGAAPELERVRALLAARLPFYMESEVIVRGPHSTKRAYARVIADRLRAR